MFHRYHLTFWFASFTYYNSVLAPCTSSVPLVTTNFRIGCRAEILLLCWQLVLDTPVAYFHTLLHSFISLISPLLASLSYYTIDNPPYIVPSCLIMTINFLTVIYYNDFPPRNLTCPRNSFWWRRRQRGPVQETSVKFWGGTKFDNHGKIKFVWK